MNPSRSLARNLRLPPGSLSISPARRRTTGSDTPGGNQTHNLIPIPRMQRITKHLLQLTAALALALGTAQAADKADGKWSWTMPGRGGGEGRKVTLTLKTDGEKLTGSLTNPGRQGAEARETPIEEGKVTGNEVSFKATREWNGQKMVVKYSGKVEGDSIKGKIETERDGQTRSRDWEAKREAAK